MELNQLPARIQTITITHPNVRIDYPQLVGLSNSTAQLKINQALLKDVHDMIRQQGYYENPKNTEMLGIYEIKNNQRGIVSISQSNYAFTYPSAHGLTLMKSITADIQTGKIFSLSDLFKPGSDYVKVLSEMVQQQINQRQIPILEYKGIRPDQDYYIADKALVIYFQVYEISPYYVGFPMFPISVYDLQSIMNEDGPLSVMAAS
ncbi:DUF3298 and DUF4163 domain-containing protein [Brevibacillus sp. H7]|uniref:DUF3298 and DUF4163 domain-containing protein n=1 Tax=Brevibacillus sp. H7 TaxID=3349138 RepID=UPI0037FCF8BB